jgi:predicted nuclease of predicted toxin-antitoxin system
MPVYIIDVNLPYYFSLWNSDDFVFVKDLDDEWKDTEIWNYALDKNLIILTKDADFFDRVMVSKYHPKVIHICFGKTLMKEFFGIMEKIWPQILSLNNQYEVIKDYNDKIVIVK